MISIGSDITILDVTGKAKFKLGINEACEHSCEIMTKNECKIVFNLTMMFDFRRGDYIEYDEVRYTLRKNYQPKQSDDGGEFAYEMLFEGPDMMLKDAIFFYTLQGFEEIEWKLTGTPRQFLEAAVATANSQLGTNWKVGVYPEMEPTLVEFDSTKIFDGLTQVAEIFEIEWYADCKAETLNFTKKYEHGNSVELVQGKSILGINRTNENSEDYCNRLYVLGSTRNIPSNYRGIESGEVIDSIGPKRLRMPIEIGDYLDAIPDMYPNEVDPKVVKFDHIYPKRVGTITEVRSVDRTKEESNPFIVYFIKDSGLEFKSKYKLPGEKLKLHFESGNLIGRDFELEYHDNTGEFEIINDTSNSMYTVPNDILKPKVGDQYVLYNFNIELVGNQYIPEAEKELEREGREYLKKVAEDNATYECANSPGYCYEEGIDLGLGRKVRLVSDIFIDGYKESRIYGFRKSLYSSYACTYIIGDASRKSRSAAMKSETQKVKDLAEFQYKELTKNQKTLDYIRQAMENDTVIDQGMILTTLLRLGAKAGNDWKEAAVISGIYNDPSDVAIAVGGSYEDAINNLAAIIFRMDGSGHLASGNIKWDALGNPQINGSVTSVDEYGNTIALNADNHSIQLIDAKGNKVGEWNYNMDNDGIVTGYNSEILLTQRAYENSDGSINPAFTKSVKLNVNGITFYDNRGKTLHIASKIPNHAINAEIGDVWSDKGKLMLLEEEVPE